MSCRRRTAAVLPDPQNTSLQVSSAPSCDLMYSLAWCARAVVCAPLRLSSVCVLAYSGMTRSVRVSSTQRSARPDAM